MDSSFDPSGPALSDGVFGLPLSAAESRVILMPVAWEATTSYRRGTALGPANILECSRQVDLFDPVFGKVYERGIHMLGPDADIEELNRRACSLAMPIIQQGGAIGSRDLSADLAAVNELSLALNRRVREGAQTWLDQGKVVGIVGGDHASPYGLIELLSERFAELGILHIDAHADLRQAYEGFEHSHASIMFNVHQNLPHVSIAQIGIRDFCEEESALIDSSARISTVFDYQLAEEAFLGRPKEPVFRALIDRLPENVYVSFDIDGLEPSNCPATGTPVPGGLSFNEAGFLLRTLARSGRRVVGFDLNEVSGTEQWDGMVGARVLYRMCGLV